MKAFTLLSYLLLLAAAPMCSPSADKLLSAADTNIKKAEDSCLMEFTGDKEGKFFTEQLIRDLANGNTIMSNHHETAHLYKYNWKEDGVIHVIEFDEMQTAESLRLKRNELNKDVPNLVVEHVQYFYRDNTPEEKERLDELFDEQIEKTQDAKAISGPTQSLQSKAVDMEQNAYIPLESKADYAVYNRKSFGLYVVVGEVLLSLSAQVGPYGSVDEEKGIELARKLADKVAAVCD